MDRPTVLVVSEDMGFATSCYEQMHRHGLRAIACLGPAHGPCLMARLGSCPLAEKATAVIVNAPSGAFGRPTNRVPAGDYATELQRRHPRPWVLMTAGPEGRAGRTGEVTVVDRRAAVDLLALLLDPDPADRRERGQKVPVTQGQKALRAAKRRREPVSTALPDCEEGCSSATPST